MTAEPSVNSSGPAAVGPLDWPAAELGRWSVGTLVGLLGCTAALVAWRRLAGALSKPLDPSWLLSVGGLVVVATVGVRILWHHAARQSEMARPGGLVAILASAAMLCLGAALSLPGTRTGGLVVFWALLVGEEAWAWGPVVWRRLGGGRGALRFGRAMRVDAAQKLAPHGLPAESPPTVFAELPLTGAADDVLQQLARTRAADGSEQLSGWLRAPFAAGQRTASVHVAFCPSFAKTPQLTVEQLDGPPARIKEAQLLPHGTRIDLKLAAVAEKADSVLLQISARSKGAEVDGGQ